MSSHHIVRENQEPALIVYSTQALSQEQLGQVLEWSPTLVTDDYHLDFLTAQGTKVDLLFSDHKSALSQEQIEVFATGGDFMSTALRHLMINNYKAVNILCDRMLDSFYTFAEQINIVVFCQGKRHVYVKHIYEKWKTAKELIYVNDLSVKFTRGLHKITDNQYETINDGFFRIEFTDDNLVAVAEDL